MTHNCNRSHEGDLKSIQSATQFSNITKATSKDRLLSIFKATLIC